MAGRSSARPRGVVAALVSMAVASLVAGCGDGGDPAATPSGVTSSPSATASPSETAATASPTETSALPPLPDAAKENTPEGAEAFIRYYLDVANQLYMDPPAVKDVDNVVSDSLVDPECVSCETLRTELTQLSQNGQRTLGALYTIDSMERVGGAPPEVQRFNMTVTMLDHVIETTQSGEQDEYQGRQVSGLGAAVWTGSQWVVYDMELG